LREERILPFDKSTSKALIDKHPHKAAEDRTGFEIPP
jgi:hypothetical protein